MKYVEGDPMTSMLVSACALSAMKHQLHKKAERRREENARKAEADKTRFYKISTIEINKETIYYVAHYIKDSYKKAETWFDRLQIYNEALVDYLRRKSYCLRIWEKPEYFTLNLNQYKEITKKSFGGKVNNGKRISKNRKCI
jgi:hypothetical protein